MHIVAPIEHRAAAPSATCPICGIPITVAAGKYGVECLGGCAHVTGITRPDGVWTVGYTSDETGNPK